jgi:hypothetical protein
MLLATAALLANAPALAQVSAMSKKTSGPQLLAGTTVVADEVRKQGSKISGGWREYALDGSWRRVVYILDANTGTVVFGDGKRGSRIPSVTRYAWGGPGRADGRAHYDEKRSFAGATTDLLNKADRPSPIPGDVASRVRDLGGDIRLLRRLADIEARMQEVGSAFDAARRSADESGLTAGFPGTATPGRKGNWSDPRQGIGRDGRAGDDVISSEFVTDSDGTRGTVVTRHDDGTTTTDEYWSNDRGTGISSTTRNSSGDITYSSSGSMMTDGSTRASSFVASNPKTGEGKHFLETTNRNGGHTRRTWTGTPSETSSGRGHEAEIARYVPWLADANYAQWKREADLIKSGGRVTQPGGQGSVVLNEGPEVGIDGVVNCGDSNANPCKRMGGVNVDVKGRFDTISQPGRGVPTGPVDDKAPRPIPVPEPKP